MSAPLDSDWRDEERAKAEESRQMQLAELRTIAGHLDHIRWLLVFVMCLLAVLAFKDARAAPRSAAQRAEFKRQQPCPATGQARGACPGYVVDHIHPLCAGGLDHPSNMQWQAVREAKLKDREESALCRTYRR